ncbi:hypothetical protein SK128_026423 [Halocaridina rubra]|uniref:Uncharacterized protein n=1 Tax=Halocaridina rubra TaxID=373956 RepID=A0AAN8XE76_HALRR
MACATTVIEEIPRREVAPPQIRLQIISLNLNDRGKSVTPPPPRTRNNEEKTLLPYVHKPLVLKRMHKLQSFDHMLQAIEENKCSDKNNIPSMDIPNGNLHSKRKTFKKQRTFDKESQTENFPQGGKPYCHDNDSTYIIFVKGMNEVFTCDIDKVVNTIVNLLNKHVVNVTKREHKLFMKEKRISSKDAVNQIILKGAMLALDELVHEGILDITPQGYVQIAQGVTFALCFHKTLLQFGKNIWNSKQAEFIRDAWISFGGLAAVLVMSATRQNSYEM